MAATSLTANFWGEKNSGFDILYHNMKYGLESSKELSDFLRESCSAEENYARSQAKLARCANNSGNKGSFGPFWQVLKTFADKLSNLHQQLAASWVELNKEVQKYITEQQKKHKEVKECEASTMETVQSLQQTITAVQKTKEVYHARSFEMEKCKREGATAKELERVEAKTKRANEEYKGQVEKYANVRNEFDVAMTESCKRFEELECRHLQQMMEFIDTYIKSWSNQYALLGQVQDEFLTSCKTLTVDKLIETFVQNKGTGTEKPGPIEFEEPDLSTLPALSATPNAEKKEFTLTDRTRREVGGFLNRNRRRDKKKKKKEQEDKDREDENVTAVATPQVDDEGYIIVPEHNMQNHADRDSWYSSSDSSDNEEREKRNKIKVEIKPMPSNNAAAASDNVNDIRSLVMNLRLSPTIHRKTPVNDGNMKRSTSASDNISNSPIKPSQYLAGLDFSTDQSSTNLAYSLTSPTEADAVDLPHSNELDSIQTEQRSNGATDQNTRQRNQSTTSLTSALRGPPPARSSRTNLPLMVYSTTTKNSLACLIKILMKLYIYDKIRLC